MQTALFDKYDLPDFTGLSAEEAWQACEDWENCMYHRAEEEESLSEDWWNEAAGLVRANYDRYYKEYENE